MKICSKCKVEKPVEAFYRSSISKGGFACWCKRCDNSKGEAWRKNNPDKRKQTQRWAKLKHHYELTKRGFEDLLLKQGGKCAICFCTFNYSSLRGRVAVTVDHCHKSGAVRGLLCGGCNLALGIFKDSEALLIQAAEYLRKNKQTS